MGGVNSALLACGSGEMAQLGCGVDVIEAPRPRPVLAMGNVNAELALAGGGANALIVNTKAGKKELWTWGCNDHGVLGRPTKGEEEQATPGVVTSMADKDVIQVSLGDYHMLVLDSEGLIYSCGTYRDANGIIGFRPGNSDKQLELELLAEMKDKRVIAIASGENTSYAVTDAGHLYVWGDARINQRTSTRGDHKLLGLLPAHVPCSKKITAAFAGAYHVLLLTTEGNLWAMGLNNHQQLGTGGSEISTLPKQVKGLPKNTKIKMAAAGQHHSALLTEDGIVYTWGRGDYGQLGHGNYDPCDAPTPVAFFDKLKKEGNKVIQISCGGHHTLATMANGDVYAWGFGTMFQLGIGQMDNGDDDRNIPTQLNNTDPRSKLHGKKVVWASGGGQHSLFVVTPAN